MQMIEKTVNAERIEQLIDVFGSFDENIKGRIKEGYLADLAVLSDDIFTISSDNIKDIKVEMTVVDGKIVYQRNK